jgi:hypothetical protein
MGSMTIRLNGMSQAVVHGILADWKPGNQLVASLARGIMNKVFPADRRRPAEVPGPPGRYDAFKLCSIPESAIEISSTEVETLLTALKEAEPTISVANGLWYYPLIESLKEATTDVPKE